MNAPLLALPLAVLVLLALATLGWFNDISILNALITGNVVGLLSALVAHLLWDQT